MSSKSINLSREAKLRTELATVLGKTAKVHVQGEEVRVADVLDVLDVQLANARATAEANAVYRRVAVAEREYRAQKREMLSGVYAALVATLSSEQLAQLGLVPKKKARALTAAERTLATAKLRVTRKSNGTRGKKQRHEAEVSAGLAAVYGSPPPDKPGGGAAPPPAG
jgi:hypothetical protein